MMAAIQSQQATGDKEEEEEEEEEEVPGPPWVGRYLIDRVELIKCFDNWIVDTWRRGLAFAGLKPPGCLLGLLRAPFGSFSGAFS